MTDSTEWLRKYLGTGVLLDSNLLLLLFLGGYQREQISSNKRLAAYTEQDFDLLTAVVAKFPLVITTPNILTEVSNLSGGIPEHQRAAYFTWFSSRLALLQEEFVSSISALESPWGRFGLTDAVIGSIAKNRYLVLTDDFRLSQALQSDGIDTLNFNHLREPYWHHQY